MTLKEIHNKYPYLKCSEDNPWCYGNSDDISWWNNIDSGWKDLHLKMFDEWNEVLNKYNELDKLYIEQLKEKWGMLRIYYSGVSSECMKELNKITNKYEDVSYKTCIKCGKPAKYRTTGYILPYCENCVGDAWCVEEI